MIPCACAWWCESARLAHILRYFFAWPGPYTDLDLSLFGYDISSHCVAYILPSCFSGRLAFHGIDPVASYFDQKEETQPYIDRFVSSRMPRWLSYFERALKANNEGKGWVCFNLYYSLGRFSRWRIDKIFFLYVPEIDYFMLIVFRRQFVVVFLCSGFRPPLSSLLCFIIVFVSMYVSLWCFTDEVEDTCADRTYNIICNWELQN